MIWEWGASGQILGFGMKVSYYNKKLRLQQKPDMQQQKQKQEQVTSMICFFSCLSMYIDIWLVLATLMDNFTCYHEAIFENLKQMGTMNYK